MGNKFHNRSIDLETLKKRKYNGSKSFHPKSNRSTVDITMDSTPKNLMWKCFDKVDEKRKMLERELPTGFEYIVNRFKIVEESSVPHESKFEAGFIVKVCDEEKQDKFIKSFVC